MSALATRTTDVTVVLWKQVSARLAEEFSKIPEEAVDRRVADVLARVRHLGVAATPEVVERVAREHLLALVNSEPPSGIPR
ncbi:hypothetical protein Misp01_30750 [Microtetraspora sp. NBRC 13810]|uniref:hypothetical protein n=1 Tax=Microtetraspora sp. NBRC 13810 TaxID=3030990 RepID=UPI0024A07933|nr:hypothetical protein [Microtetraspora sp. NBRC 13810]GLW07945.1 hypothetical protein Misp01_30750 [Microtetraspora sp. NBRC 13810]